MVGGRIFEHQSLKGGTHTCTEHVIHGYSESSFALSFSGRAGTPFGQTSPCVLLGTYFFSFCQSCSLYVRNKQCDEGITLRYVCWGTRDSSPAPRTHFRGPKC